MTNGIFIFIILLTCLLSFVVGASVALTLKGEKEEVKVQEENFELRRQWNEFLSYDGNGRE